MTPETRARLFAAVPLYLWPYLWLQLWGLERWINANKRDVLFAVSHRTGKVYITAISDAPAPEGRYAYAAPEQPRHVLTPAPQPEFTPHPPHAPRACGRTCWQLRFARAALRILPVPQPFRRPAAHARRPVPPRLPR